MSTETSEIRHYRSWIKPGEDLVSFRVVYRETDLAVLAAREITMATLAFVREVREPLERYILRHPEFLKSLKPLPEDPEAPEIVKHMLRAGRACRVGPMASVAGAIAEAVGRRILEKGLSSQVAIENGGDLFLALRRPATVALYAGESPLSGKIGLRLRENLMPCGVCTSSGKLGHSLSLGKAEAVCVVAREAALADAAATALGNLVKGKRSLKKVLSEAQKWPHILAVVCIIGDEIGFYGPELEWTLL